jgi:hypothetical protein
LLRLPQVAGAACAFVACVWLNQGPSTKNYDLLSQTLSLGGHPVLAIWRPLAFAYRRSQGEEMLYAVSNAVRGAPFDRDVLVRDRGRVSAGWARSPQADGKWHTPYDEVPFEYPAIFLPLLALSAWLAPSFQVFATLLGSILGALMVSSVVLAVSASSDLSADERSKRYWLAAAMFLAAGGTLVQRLDAVPTLFLALSLWAACRRKRFVFGLGVGLAAAAKILPILLLLPMMAADRAAWSKPSQVARALGGAVLGTILGLVAPMLALSRRGLGEFFAYHAERGLHVESTWGALLCLASTVRGASSRATLSYGSFNLDSQAACLVAKLATPTLALAVLVLSIWLWRSLPETRSAPSAEAITEGGLAALLAIYLLAKTFSPQYMTWAIPFAVRVLPRRIISILFVVAMAISQSYLRGFYDQVTDARPLGVAALILRLGVLGAMAGVVLRDLGRRHRAQLPQATTLNADAHGGFP